VIYVCVRTVHTLITRLFGRLGGSVRPTWWDDSTVDILSRGWLVGWLVDWFDRRVSRHKKGHVVVGWGDSPEFD
jgi:hypothetical protein